ncbi:lysozyme inhibitor LprI family protein [Falsirhodobacter sp. alg1]|uniref:lysozyme inhibitor LprI family protein n=1 Tax=Falsirhodobacter sp. alg1 TaxID=1472418 RepID=UPI0005EE8A3D|nr:lysozyme inhibitor LprI family protein [Falsirhodobacter sp. alg1]
MIFRAAVAILCLSGPALAGEACRGSSTQTEMNACAATIEDVADQALNDAYENAMARMAKIDSALPTESRGAADALRTAQRAWLIVRDQGCAAEAWPYAGGTMQRLVEMSCRAAATEARTDILLQMATSIDSP